MKFSASLHKNGSSPAIFNRNSCFGLTSLVKTRGESISVEVPAYMRDLNSFRSEGQRRIRKCYVLG